MKLEKCPTCKLDKSKICPVCIIPDTYSGKVSCIWCGGSGLVCPKGPHFLGIRKIESTQAMNPLRR